MIALTAEEAVLVGLLRRRVSDRGIRQATGLDQGALHALACSARAKLGLAPGRSLRDAHPAVAS